jgi:hypothetical protein
VRAKKHATRAALAVELGRDEVRFSNALFPFWEQKSRRITRDLDG